MVIHGIYLNYHCNYVIHGYSYKGGPWMRVIHGIYLDYHCNYVTHGYSYKGGPWMMVIHGIYLDYHCNCIIQNITLLVIKLSMTVMDDMVFTTAVLDNPRLAEF